MTGDDRALVDRFLEMMAAEAGAAANTIAAYRSDLTLAGEAMGGLAEADEAALRRVQEHPPGAEVSILDDSSQLVDPFDCGELHGCCGAA